MILSKTYNIRSTSYICLLLIAGFFLSSCDPDLLNTHPDNRYVESTFWESEAAANAALAACYHVLRREGIFGSEATPMWEDTATPNSYNETNVLGFNNLALGTQQATNGGIWNTRWNHSYLGIGRCNTFLARIEGADSVSEQLKSRMTGEALFLRSLYYYMLTTYYGDAPLILDPPDADEHSDLPRTPRAEVVQQILSDLDQAASLLPESYGAADAGRATRGSALGLKARVLMFEASPLINTSNDQSRWQAAANAAKEVMDMGIYDLFPDFRNLFLPEYENSEEVVFDVQYISPTVSPGLGNSFDLINAQYASTVPLQELVDVFLMEDGQPVSESPLFDSENPYDNRDPRFYTTVVYPGDRFQNDDVTGSTFAHTGYALKKYTIYDRDVGTPPANDSEIKGGQSGTNFMVIRYADILLMYAEAVNEYSGPDATVYEAINKVRERAGMPGIDTGHSQDELREIIRHERRVEFAGEGLYYNDIRRWRIAEELNNGPVHRWDGQVRANRSFNPNRDYWWPIHQNQLDLNPNLEQNPGY